MQTLWNNTNYYYYKWKELYSLLFRSNKDSPTFDIDVTIQLNEKSVHRFDTKQIDHKVGVDFATISIYNFTY